MAFRPWVWSRHRQDFSMAAKKLPIHSKICMEVALRNAGKESWPSLGVLYLPVNVVMLQDPITPAIEVCSEIIGYLLYSPMTFGA
jgi:hypothetical protein